MWDVIKDIVPSKNKKSKIFNTENPMETAKTFNSFFATVGEKVYNETKKSRDEIVQAKASDSVSPQLDRPYFRPKPVKIDTEIETVLNLKK